VGARLARGRTTAALARGAARHRTCIPHRLALRGADRRWPIGRAGGAEGARPGGRRGRRAPAGPLLRLQRHGAQHAGMARPRSPSAVPRGMAAADAALAPCSAGRPLARIEAGVTAEELAATDIAQPLLFAVQAAMLPALAEQGLRPAAVLGHSVGEVAAALAAGLLGLDAAARLVVARSRHQARRRGEGRMAALNATPEEAEALVAALGEAGAGIEIAAFNGPAALTMAGPAPALDALRAAADARRLPFVALDLDYAFHSAAMDPVRDGLLAELTALHLGAPALPMLSPSPGAALAAGEADASYWWRNLREPVRFAAATRAALARGARVFLEVGRTPSCNPTSARPAARRRPGRCRWRASPGGMPRAWTRSPASPTAPSPPAPTRARARPSPARRSAACRPPPSTEAAASRPPRPRAAPDRPGRRPSAARLPPRAGAGGLDPRAGHRAGALAGRPPAGRRCGAAGGGDAGDGARGGPGAPSRRRRAGGRRVPHPPPPAAGGRRVARDPAQPRPGRRRAAGKPPPAGRGTLDAARRGRGPRRAARRAGRAAGRVASRAPGRRLVRADARRDALRARAALLGLGYGPAFAAVQDVVAQDAHALARLALPDAAPPDAGFILHPSRLDGALQGLFALLDPAATPPGTGLVPVKAGRLVALAAGAPAATAEIELTRRGARSAAARLVLRDAAGRVVARLDEAVFQRVALPGAAADPAEAAAHIELIPAAEGPPPPPALLPALAAAQGAAAALDLSEAALLLEAHVAAAAQEVPLLAAAPEAAAYLAFLRLSLVEDGAAEAGPASFRLLPDGALPPAAEIWRSVLAEHPELALDLAWIAEAAERLPEALRGARRAAAPPPLAGAALGRLAETLAAAVGAFAAAWPENRPLRILEIGAEGDLLARRVAARLAPLGRHVRYVATGEARIALPEAPPGLALEAAAWDPRGGSAPPMVADLVIGLAAAARMRAGATLAAALRPVLAEGGAVLLAEPLPGRAWTFVCGQDPAWWSGLGPDPAGGSDGGALPDAELWQVRLAEAGFRATVAERLGCAPWPAVLVGAEAPPPPAAARPAAPRTLVFAEPGAAALADSLTARLARAGVAVERRPLGEASAGPAGC
jgi:malonyl CoA-acyl carrier protein transacylase